jgi:hypothetical protein
MLTVSEIWNRIQGRPVAAEKTLQSGEPIRVELIPNIKTFFASEEAQLTYIYGRWPERTKTDDAESERIRQELIDLGKLLNVVIGRFRDVAAQPDKNIDAFRDTAKRAIEAYKDFESHFSLIVPKE